jgi:hypothetical protein
MDAFLLVDGYQLPVARYGTYSIRPWLPMDGSTTRPWPDSSLTFHIELSVVVEALRPGMMAELVGLGATQTSLVGEIVDVTARSKNDGGSSSEFRRRSQLPLGGHGAAEDPKDGVGSPARRGAVR